MPAVAENMQSDIGDLEDFERQAVRVNGRTGFGWSIPPHIERVRRVVEKTVAAKESAKPAALIPADDERDTSTIGTPSGSQEMLIISELVTSYTELIGVIRTRVGQLGVRYLDFDKLAGWAEGLSGKIFGPSEVKRLGPEKLFDALRASGMRIRLEHDPEQTQKMQARIAENFNPRQANQVRMGNRSHLSNALIDEVLNYLANRKGGLTRLNQAVKDARSNCARHAAKALWKKSGGAAQAISPHILETSRGSAACPRCDHRKIPVLPHQMPAARQQTRPENTPEHSAVVVEERRRVNNSDHRKSHNPHRPCRRTLVSAGPSRNSKIPSH
jgi:hypothetical protein